MIGSARAACGGVAFWLPETARELADEAIAIDPSLAESYVIRGYSFRAQNDHPAARAEADRARKTESTSSRARLFYAQVAHKRAIDMAPDDALYQVSYAEFLTDKGDTDAAIAKRVFDRERLGELIQTLLTAARANARSGTQGTPTPRRALFRTRKPSTPVPPARPTARAPIFNTKASRVATRTDSLRRDRRSRRPSPAMVTASLRRRRGARAVSSRPGAVELPFPTARSCSGLPGSTHC